jgi:rfaE bifunctional protein kinase chain/domain
MLKKLGVNTTIVTDTSRPTTLKQRYRAAGKTLLRVSDLRQHAISAEIADQVLQAIKDHISTADLLVFSDFNYGCLPQSLVDDIITLGHEANVLMVADSQASSQIADISRFRQMHLITPTEREARLALQDWDSGLMELVVQLQKSAQADNVVITLGAEGILIYAQDEISYMMDRLPAMNSTPKDVAGAGDSFLITSSMALRAKATMWQAAYLGALAAACQVSRVGNTPLTREELIREIDGP